MLVIFLARGGDSRAIYEKFNSCSYEVKNNSEMFKNEWFSAITLNLPNIRKHDILDHFLNVPNFFLKVSVLDEITVIT